MNYYSINDNDDDNNIINQLEVDLNPSHQSSKNNLNLSGCYVLILNKKCDGYFVKINKKKFLMVIDYKCGNIDINESIDVNYSENYSKKTEINLNNEKDRIIKTIFTNNINVTFIEIISEISEHYFCSDNEEFLSNYKHHIYEFKNYKKINLKFCCNNIIKDILENKKMYLIFIIILVVCLISTILITYYIVKNISDNIIDLGKSNHEIKETQNSSIDYFIKSNNKDFTGKGTLRYNNGNIFEGYFINGLADGEGKIYENEEKKNKKITIYEGGFKSGYLKGFGTYTCKEYKYEGQFNNSKFNGYGNYSDENHFCVGYWNNDLMNGNGKCKRYNNNYYYYDGYFLNNTKHGYGKFYENESFYYEGYFVNDNYEGRGKLDKNKKLYYDGEFKDNMFNGKGILYYEDGDYYDGYFLNNNRHGQGKVVSKEGKTRCDGEFKDDKFKKGFWKSLCFFCSDKPHC